MAFTRTMGVVVGLCQRRADKETDGQVDADEVKELIAEHYNELHAAVTEVGARYFETEADITATGASSYALPSGHLSTVGVDRVLDAAGRRQPLVELMVQERPLLSGLTGEAWLWALSGATIVLYPTPSSGTYKHLYVPQPTDYSSVGNGESIDFINQAGLRFVVWGVASVMQHKGDANQLRAVSERDRALDSLREWAVRRALTMPKRRQVRETDLAGGLDPSLLSPASWIFR